MCKARRPVWPVLLAVADLRPAPSGHPRGVGENGADTSPVTSQPMAGRDGTARIDLLAVDSGGATTATVRWRVDNPATKTLDVNREIRRGTGKLQPKNRVDGISLVDA